MQMSALDQDLTSVPLEVARSRLDDGSVLAAMPVRDLEHGTACLLVAKQGRMWVACRVDAGGPTVAPDVAIEAVEWHEVGIGPQGLVGRVPGGLLGGPQATYHLVTVQAGEHLYQAKLAGEDGMEVVEDFVSVALHAGARELEL